MGRVAFGHMGITQTAGPRDKERERASRMSAIRKQALPEAGPRARAGSGKSRAGAKSWRGISWAGKKCGGRWVSGLREQRGSADRVRNQDTAFMSEKQG